MRVLATATDRGGDVTSVSCPDCGARQLALRYVVDPDTRIGYALLWCDANLHGITVSRVQAPEGASIFPLGEPSAVEGVPDFYRHE